MVTSKFTNNTPQQQNISSHKPEIRAQIRVFECVQIDWSTNAWIWAHIWMWLCVCVCVSGRFRVEQKLFRSSSHSYTFTSHNHLFSRAGDHEFRYHCRYSMRMCLHVCVNFIHFFFYYSCVLVSIRPHETQLNSNRHEHSVFHVVCCFTSKLYFSCALRLERSNSVFVWRHSVDSISLDSLNSTSAIDTICRPCANTVYFSLADNVAGGMVLEMHIIFWRNNETSKKKVWNLDIEKV